MNFLKKAVKKTESVVRNAESAVRSGSIKKLLTMPSADSADNAESSSGDQDSSNPDQVFLHGHLLIDIVAAKDLPDMESWLAKVVDTKDVTDAFVDIK